MADASLEEICHAQVHDANACDNVTVVLATVPVDQISHRPLFGFSAGLEAALPQRLRGTLGQSLRLEPALSMIIARYRISS